MRWVMKWSRWLHVYLTMLMLVVLVFFSVSGFVLNHEEWFGVKEYRTTTGKLSVPVELVGASDRLGLVEFLREKAGGRGPVGEIKVGRDGKVRVPFRSPERMVEVAVDGVTGEAEVTTKVRGVAGLMAELHKGKSTGWAWKRVLDAVAVSLFLACVSGFVMWLMLPKRRVLGVAGLVVSVVMCVGVYVVFAR